MGAGPFIVCQVAACTAWQWLDKHTINMVAACSKFSEWATPKLGHLTKHPADGFVVPILVWLGVFLPAYFFYEFYLAVTVGFSWKRIAIYNLIRIGPQYANFMNLYVLAHYESHNFGSLFKKRYPYLKYVFNHYAGIFHGVLGGTFTYSHIYNHHRYDNDERDVYSTAFFKRDEFVSWVKYLYTWFAYASNLSTIISFLGEGRYYWAAMCTLCTVAYCAVVAAIAYIHPLFALTTLVYAFVEGNILLCAVNYVWHAFIDPEDPSNDYVNSTTVIEGVDFTLGEEMHVVHHQYAGVHWTKKTAMYEKHLPEYKACLPSIFYKVNIFEIFGMIVSKNYMKLAEIYHKPFIPKGMTQEQLAEVLKKRLQCHGPELAARVGRTHKAKQLDRELVAEMEREEAAPTTNGNGVAHTNGATNGKANGKKHQ